jgi:hypothetical protein
MTDRPSAFSLIEKFDQSCNIKVMDYGIETVQNSGNGMIWRDKKMGSRMLRKRSTFFNACSGQISRESNVQNKGISENIEDMEDREDERICLRFL